MTFHTLGIVLVFIMVPFATANPILYGRVFRWRSSPEGRAVMTLCVGMALLIDLSVVYVLAPAIPARAIVACVVYALILTGLVRFTVVVIRALRDQHRRHP